MHQTTTTQQPLQQKEKNSLLLVIAASAAGTLIEWYDLFVAIILASTLSQHFFQGKSRFLETLAVVGSSYLIRPVGALLFGGVGDKKGRKRSFLYSLLLMGTATFLIGCLPTFQQVGWLAPVLLLLLRLCQGLAISGEYAGATIYVAEHSPANKRGYYTGFIQATVPFGLMICLLVVFGTSTVMGKDAFNAWGWRIPFLFSSVLVVLSYLLRRRLKESPVFHDLKMEGKIEQSPVNQAFKQKGNLRLMLLAVFGGNAAQSTIMHCAQFVSLYFLQLTVHINNTTALLILAAANLAGGMFFQPFGALSDRIGRKKVILAGLIASAVIIPACFYLFVKFGNPQGLTVEHDISTRVTFLFIGLVFLMSLCSAMVYGPIGAFMLELFPTKIRYTSMGFSYNIGNGVFGGSTAFITEFLKRNLVVGVALAPYIGLVYPLSLVVIAICINAAYVPETYTRNLEEE
ncbi:MAG TPA: MFS transporter [Chitinophagaceae bacterium]|nr:MFS transporter [Chitinophagaceae bacterium]